MKYVLALVTVIVVALGVATGQPHGTDDWSPVIYPAQRIPLIFSHATHQQRGVPCAACHAGATTSRSAVDNLLPTEAECRACHPIDRAQPERVVAGAPPARCAACHPGYVPGQPVQRVYLETPPLKFDHAAHVKQPCASCHGDLSKVDLATRKHLPTMQSCLACHKDGTDERRCADCHLAKLGGLIETEYPQGTLVPKHSGMGDAHGAGFGKDHRQEAMQLGATCSACHDRSECLACHQGVARPLDFHSGDYLRVHAVEAKRGTPDCSACHRAQSFCVGCHERSGIGNRAPGEFVGTGAFHPPSWLALHPREAKRNIQSCASCHREDDCLACHSAEPTAAMRASPHPKGWRGSAKCKALDSKNRRMCLRCHVTQDELGCDWRAN
jgi:hypothetical protein